MRTVLLVPALLLLAARPACADPAEVWTGKPVWVARTAATVYDVSADGTRVLFSDGNALGLFDRAAGKLVWRAEKTATHDAKFSPGGKTVAVGAWQQGVNFYDAATGKKLRTLAPGAEWPWQVHYRPDGTLLYSTSASGFSASPPWTLKYSAVHYDPAANRELGKASNSVTYDTTNPWVTHRGAGFFMEFHQIFGTNSTTRRIAHYTDPVTGKRSPTITLGMNDIPLDLSPDGKVLLVMAAGFQPRLVDTATGRTKFNLEGHKRHVTDAAYSPDGKLVATVTGTHSRHALRGATDTSGKVPTGPAEYAIWNAATGKLVARAEFPTTEFDFVRVQFGPDSKFLLLASREGPNGKGQSYYAVGKVPFGAAGGAELTFPIDEAAKPKVAPSGALVSDPLDRLIEEMAKSSKPAGDKIDALFLAALGRFALEREKKWVRDTHGDKLTADALRKVLAEIAKSPEFDAHLKSLQQRAPAKPIPFQWGGSFVPQLNPPFGPQTFGPLPKP